MKIKDNVLIKVDNNDIIDGTFNIPDNVTKIGKFSFYGCKKLKKVIIPNSVIEITDYAFTYCDIESITIPNSVAVIGGRAFADTNLKEIIIPNSVKEVEEYAFVDCPKLERAIVPFLTKIHEFSFDPNTKVSRVLSTAKLMNKNQLKPNPTNIFNSIMMEMQIHINNLKKLEIKNLNTTESMSIEKFGDELNSYPMIISSAFYSSQRLDENIEARNENLEKLLNKIVNDGEQTLFEKIGNIFLNVKDGEIVLNKDAMNQLKTFSESELDTFRKQTQVLEGLKEMSKLYAEKLNMCKQELNTVIVSDVNDEFDKMNINSLNSSVQIQFNRIQNNLSNMLNLYNSICNAINLNIMYVTSLKEVTEVLLP